MSAIGPLHRLLASQSPDGAFSSTVHLDDRSMPDLNGFITALVLRALRRHRETAALRTARARACRFLMACRSPTTGAFGFWPGGQTPAWIRGLPDDTDDTAVVALELARHGHLDRSALRRLACTILIPNRVRRIDGAAPPWLRPGAFKTWLRAGDAGNPVDCCVNANVAALLAFAGLHHLPGYLEACSVIEAGLRWAGDSRARLGALTPFYPDPSELVLALDHAVACGASRLSASLALLEEMRWASAPDAAGRPICASAYGRVYWTSEALATARRLERARAGAGIAA